MTTLRFLMLCFLIWGIVEHERRVFFKRKWLEAREYNIKLEQAVDSLNIQIQQKIPITINEDSI